MMPIRNIRAAARQSIKDSQSHPYRLNFLFVLCLNGPLLLFSLLDASVSAGLDTSSGGIGAVNIFAVYTAAVSLVSLVLSFVLNVWQMCYQNFTLNLSRGRNVSFRDFTAPFRIFLKVFWLNFLVSLYTACWTMAFCFPLSFAAVSIAPEYMLELIASPDFMNSPLLYVFTIPGWIMAYRYRLAFLVLFDHEEWSASKAIRESIRLTHGFRMSLFRLDLSYWWYHIPVLFASSVLPVLLLEEASALRTDLYLLASAAPLLLDTLLRIPFQLPVLTASAHTYHYILEHAIPPVAPPPVTYQDSFPVFRGPENTFPPADSGEPDSDFQNHCENETSNQHEE